MLEYRIAYERDGAEFLTPFIFGNIADARQARKHFKELGRKDVRILCKRPQDNEE